MRFGIFLLALRATFRHRLRRKTGFSEESHESGGNHVLLLRRSFLQRALRKMKYNVNTRRLL